MKMSEADGLSSEDLRNRLYYALKQKGLVDSLKSQLRNRLVTELQNVGLSQTFPSSESDGGSLLLRASNSLVAEHLRRCHYDYSFSVFLPEISTSEDKLLKVKDLLQLLHISPHSKLYSSLVNRHADDKGFLWSLLVEIAGSSGQSNQSTACQTEEVRIPAASSLESEFRKVEEHFAAVRGSHQDVGIEERILSYQQKLEQRMSTELSLQMARFKENELARIRMEERENNRQAVAKVRRELDSQYKVKSEALLQRERHARERSQQMEHMTEKETFAQRQSVLEEIEAVHQRDVTMRRQQEIDQREKVLWEEKIKSREELAKVQVETARKKEMEFDQRLREECARFKLEEQQRYMERAMNLEFRESKVQDDERRLFKELQDVSHVKEELRTKRQEVNHLEGELAKSQRNLITGEKEIEILSDKSREMADYQIMKEQNSIMKSEIQSLKTRLTEVSRDNIMERQKQESLLREMTDLVSKPTPEVLLLQKELEKHRNELKQDRAIFEHFKYQAERRLNDEIDRNRELLRKFEEQTLQMKEAGREVKDLRQQLLQTRSALDNEVYRNPKNPLVLNLNRSGSFCDLADNPAELAEPLRLSAKVCDSPRGHPGLPINTEDSEDYSYSLDLVQETKRRLRNLESEAQNLEQNYRNFHLRLAEPPSPLRSPVVRETIPDASVLATPRKQQPPKVLPLSSTPAQPKPSSRRTQPANYSLTENSVFSPLASPIHPTKNPLHVSDLDTTDSYHERSAQLPAAVAPAAVAPAAVAPAAAAVVSLDSAWKSQPVFETPPQAQIEEDMGASAPVEEQREETAENIDPVMLKYMAMIQEQKNKQPESTTESRDRRDQSPVQSEQELSLHGDKSDSFEASDRRDDFW